MLSDFSETVRSAISHKATIDSYIKDIKYNNISIGNKSKELDTLNELLRVTRWSYSYLDELVKDESGKFIRRLNSILDYGVKTIFDDCDYSIEIRVTDNNKAVIHLVYEDSEGNKLEPDIKDCGGGIQSCVAFLMQVYFILLYKVEPIIFIDEGLSAISKEYLPNFMGLVHELAEKNNLKIFLITHDERFLDYADKIYRVDNHKVKEVTRKGEMSEDGSDTDDIEA